MPSETERKTKTVNKHDEIPFNTYAVKKYKRNWQY